MNIVLKEADYTEFKEWLGLNLNSISWEGRYLSEFNTFWAKLFSASSSVNSQFASLHNLERSIKAGPLSAWFQWIKEKFICYLYIHHNYSINEISQISKVPVKSVALILRNFLVERLPHLESILNDYFQVGNILSPNLNGNFEKFKNENEIQNELLGSEEGEVLVGLEITLYSEWSILENFISSSVSDKKKKKKKILKDEKLLGSQIKFVNELLVLFLVGALFIFAVKYFNKYYEDVLVKEISLFAPNFFWLDKNLSFKEENILAEEVERNFDELEKLEKLEAKNVFTDKTEATRFEVESDVVLTSVDTLPKDFTVADLEQSNYEEVRKGGYRNVRYGRRKAYRVMMTSVNPEETKKKLVAMLPKYNIKQVDNVKPGTKIPGGIYFNLYVPRPLLKQFLSKATAVEKKATILESKTVFGGPSGTNKVFIWIKSI